MEYTEEEINKTANNTVGVLEKMEEGMKKASRVVQLSTDATQLLSQTAENFETIKNTGFFQRFLALFKRHNPKTKSLPSEVTKEEFKALQEYARQSLEALNERNLLTADALITVKNNLNSLDVKQQEIKEAVIQMAQRVSDRFNKLESRVDYLEDCQNLMLWIDGLEYDEQYLQLPETIRFLKVVKDFYLRKRGNYNREHLLLVKKALKSVGLEYKKEISLGVMIDSLVDELEGFDEKQYLEITSPVLKNDSALDAKKLNSLLAVPSFNTLCQMGESKQRLKSAVTALASKTGLSSSDAMKAAIKGDISGMYAIDLKKGMSLSDLGIELISCYSVIPELVEENQPKKCSRCGQGWPVGTKFCQNCGEKL